MQDSEGVGFTQLHVADAGEGGGMDLVLLATAQGQGIGTAVVHLMVRRAKLEKGWSRFTVDPDTANEVGIAFWRKVGFISQRIIQDDPRRKPYCIMAWPSERT